MVDQPPVREDHGGKLPARIDTRVAVDELTGKCLAAPTCRADVPLAATIPKPSTVRPWLVETNGSFQ